MTSPKILLDLLDANNLKRVVGVPDSTLKDFLNLVSSDSRFSYLTTTNECEAVSIAMGNYLGSGLPSVVFLQNSGLGKIVHPLTSLLSKDICHLPVLLLIGFRGDPRGKEDEPQHKMMGRIMENLLQTLEIPYDFISKKSDDEVQETIQKAITFTKESKLPFALIIRPGDFDVELSKVEVKGIVKEGRYPLIRKEVIEKIVTSLPSDTHYISTTGKISRELYFIREEKSESHANDFYTVGGMGQASSIALGISEVKPQSKICILDGDGAALMHLCHLVTLGKLLPSNIVHIVLDNEAHESTGSQATMTETLSLQNIATSCGIKNSRTIHTEESLKTELKDRVNYFLEYQFIVIKISTYSNPKLGRPKETPKENARNFQNKLLHQGFER